MNEKKIAVIVPAYNEELLIEKTLNSIPNFVDKIIVINDGSKDRTLEILKNFQKNNSKLYVINNKKNSGVGQALITGYNYAFEEGYDIGVVMPGDAQALPEDFEELVLPVVNEKADYAKGNRLNYYDVQNIMPKHRFFGNTLLTLLTKFASGYYHIMDPQMGYTALNLKILPKLQISKLIKRYGYPGHLLYLLNLCDAKVIDVNVKPHYGEEKSGIRLVTFVPKLIYLLIRLFFSRVFKKLIKKNLSPAGLSYFFSFLMLFIPIPFTSFRAISTYVNYSYVTELNLIALSLSFVLFFLFFFFGILFDVQENKDLIGN